MHGTPRTAYSKQRDPGGRRPQKRPPGDPDISIPIRTDTRKGRMRSFQALPRKTKGEDVAAGKCASRGGEVRLACRLCRSSARPPKAGYGQMNELTSIELHDGRATTLLELPALRRRRMHRHRCGRSRRSSPPGSCSAAARTEAPGRSAARRHRLDALLQREITEWDEFIGRFEASRAVEIRPRVSGAITAVHFRDGQIVRKGQPLFTIDPRPYAGRPARGAGRCRRRSSELALARSELDRASRLVEFDAVSKSEIDRLKARERAASAALAAAQCPDCLAFA